MKKNALRMGKGDILQMVKLRRILIDFILSFHLSRETQDSIYQVMALIHLEL